jgi:mannose-6-phosphate isomerase class I
MEGQIIQLPKDERQKQIIIVHKALHRQLKIEQHEPQIIYGTNNEYYTLCGTSQMVEIFNIFEFYHHRDNLPETNLDCQSVKADV